MSNPNEPEWDHHSLSKHHEALDDPPKHPSNLAWKRAISVLNATRRFREGNRLRTITHAVRATRCFRQFMAHGDTRGKSFAIENQALGVASELSVEHFDAPETEVTAVSREHICLSSNGDVSSVGSLPHQMAPQQPSEPFYSSVLDACKDLRVIIFMVCALLLLGVGIKSHGIKEGWIDGASIARSVMLVVLVASIRDYVQSLQFLNLSKEKRNIPSNGHVASVGSLPDQMASRLQEHNPKELGGVQGGVAPILDASRLENGPKDDTQYIEECRDKFGQNTYPQKPPKPFHSFVFDVCKDPIVTILMDCALLSLGFGIKSHGIKGGWYDGARIALGAMLVVLVTSIGNYSQSLEFLNLSGEKRNIPSDGHVSSVGSLPDQMATLLQERNPHALEELGGVQGVAHVLDASLENGLKDDTRYIQERRDKFGPNTYPQQSSKPFYSFVFDACKDPTVMMVCTLLSLGFGIKSHGIQEGWSDETSIAFAVVLFVLVTSIREYRQSLQFLNLSKEKRNDPVNVIRGGRKMQVSIFDLVVGDLVSLGIGDQVSADGLFVVGHSLTIDESCRTGESGPVRVDHKMPYLRSGCKVADGYGTMLVTAVGMRTEWGYLMSGLGEDLDEETPLQVCLNGVATFVGQVVLFVPALVLLIMM